MLKEVEIKLKYVKNSMFVQEVYINNIGPFDFMVSSDTPSTILDKTTAEKIRLDLKEAGMGIGAGGQVPMYETNLKNFQIKDIKIENIKVVVADLSSISAAFGLEIAGVIANDLLRSLKAIIDYGNATLKLSKST